MRIFRLPADLLAKVGLRWLSGTAYWKLRARIFGSRSVLNLGHRPEAFDEVTRRQKTELLPLLKGLLEGSEKLLLDLGCGPGRFTPELAEMTRARVIGTDVVPALLAAAPRSRGVEYRVMQEGAIPLDDRSADVVWVCLVLGGLDDGMLDQTCREIRRVTRPGGLLFMVENTADKQGDRHWHFRSVDGYRRAFPDFDLKVIHEYDDLGERISVIAGRSAR